MGERRGVRLLFCSERGYTGTANFRKRAAAGDPDVSQ